MLAEAAAVLRAVEAQLADAGIAMPAWQDALRRYLEVVQARDTARTL